MLETIKSNEEISYIFSNGHRLSNRFINFIYLDNDLESKSFYEHDHKGRVAFIAGKKNGGAVWRNSAKRRMREIYRLSVENVPDADILMIAKSSIMDAPFNDVLENCRHSFIKLRNRL